MCFEHIASRLLYPEDKKRRKSLEEGRAHHGRLILTAARRIPSVRSWRKSENSNSRDQYGRQASEKDGSRTQRYLSIKGVVLRRFRSDPKDFLGDGPQKLRQLVREEKRLEGTGISLMKSQRSDSCGFKESVR